MALKNTITLITIFCVLISSNAQSISRSNISCLSNVKVSDGFYFLNGVNQLSSLRQKLYINHPFIAQLSQPKSSNFKVIIYPNPTTGSINIKANSSIYKSEIFDSKGQLLFSTKENNCDLSNLSNGIYIIQTTDIQGHINSHKIQLIK